MTDQIRIRHRDNGFATEIAQEEFVGLCPIYAAEFDVVGETKIEKIAPVAVEVDLHEQEDEAE